MGISASVFANDVNIDIKLDGENSTVNVLAIPVGKDVINMKSEMSIYSRNQMNNEDSNVSTIRSGITEIAKKYGFTNVNININSQFGENQIPMLVVVDGVSMVPTLKNGEIVIILKSKDIKVGDIVVAKDPEYGLLIKRVGKISGDKVFLSADNNNTETVIENGVEMQMVSVEKWVNASNVVGIAKIFNV